MEFDEEHVFYYCIFNSPPIILPLVNNIEVTTKHEEFGQVHDFEIIPDSFKSCILPIRLLLRTVIFVDVFYAFVYKDLWI